MSCRPYASVVFSDMRPCQYSVELTVWMILGQVLFFSQRSSSPPARPATSSLTLPHVRRDASGGDVRVHPLKDNAVGFVLIESKIEEGAHVASALRTALHDGGADAANERVGRSGIIRA